MKTFKEYCEKISRTPSPNHYLEEGRHPSRSFIIGIQAKIHSLGKSIRDETDIQRKLDLMSQQIEWSSMLTAMDLSTNLKDPSVIKRRK